MLPTWLVYILIALILIVDVLLVIEVVVVSVFLAGFAAFNIITAILGRKVDRFIRDRLDRMKRGIESRSRDQGAGNAAGTIKTVYSILFTLYRVYDIATGLVVALIAFVLLVLGMAGLALVNLALFWLLNAYIF